MWTKDQCRYAFGSLCVASLVLLQAYAWTSGHNGVVFATISAIIGGVAGTLLGFDLGIKRKTE